MSVDEIEGQLMFAIERTGGDRWSNDNDACSAPYLARIRRRKELRPREENSDERVARDCKIAPKGRKSECGNDRLSD